MILTQDEAKKWSQILKGFSEGKEYEIPMIYNNDGNVIQWAKITDFEVNKNCPTIRVTHWRSLTPIDPNIVREVQK